MSDRGEWDPWDFGEPEPDPDAWEEQEAWEDDEVLDEPAAAGSWEDREDDPGPPRGALLAALAVMAVLALGIGALVVIGDDDGDDDATTAVDTERSTTTLRRTTTSSTTSTTEPEAEGDAAQAGAGGGDDEARSGRTPTTAASRTTTTLPTTTTAPPDETPGCATGGGGPAQPPVERWERFWTSQPHPNDPILLSICASDITPRVGQSVTFYLKAEDPDAPIPTGQCGLWIDFTGDDQLCGNGRLPPPEPRPTPAEQPGVRYLTVTHVFGAPGRTTVLALAQSGTDEQNPYESSAIARLTVDVEP